MNQSFINGLHSVIRLLLTLGLVFFLFNTAFDERFISFWNLLAILAFLFIMSAFIEIKFTPTTDFWLRLPVRFIAIFVVWLTNLFLLLTVNRETVMATLFLILTFNLLKICYEWYKARKNKELLQEQPLK